MRSSLLALSLLAIPAALWADDLPVDSEVTSVTVFPQGATLTREGDFAVPAGQHQLILTDMPLIDPASLRLSAPGLTIGAIRYRDDFTPPRTPEVNAAIEDAEAEVERQERAVEVARDAVASIRIEAEAARSRIAFLDKIGDSDGLANADPQALRDLAQMIGEVGLTARRDAQAAETRAREAERDVAAAVESLAEAKLALKALDTEAEERAYLAIDVRAAEAIEGVLSLTYMTEDAAWRPTYDVRLTTGDAAGMEIDRGAYIQQSTGENWTDVALTLSTVRPAEQGEPGEVWPWLRRIFDKEPPRPSMLTKERFSADAAAPMAEPSIVAEEVQAGASFDGLSVTYSYPDTVNVANRADAVKIALGTLELDPEIYAQAIPLADRTAYLTAGFTNNSGELILGTDRAQFYLDGTFVGQRYMDLIAEGDEAELSFGPIEGLRLERIVQDRQQGDRGVITRSNQEVEQVEITLRNLTGRDWDVRMRDRVPYSEQEDLEITWQSSPMPTEENVDGKRGVLEWRFDMAPGAEQRVTLSHTLKWPEDKVLR